MVHSHIDHWNSNESLEINPHKYSQLIFHKDAENTQWGEDSLFNKQCWKIEYSHIKEWKWTLIIQHSQNQLKWIKYLKYKTWTIKRLGKKHTEKFSWRWFWLWFFGYVTKLFGQESKIKWGYIKLEVFCIAKEGIRREKQIYKMGENTSKQYIWQGINIQNM